MRVPMSILAAVLLSVAFTACSHRYGPASGAAEPVGPTLLEVDNQGFANMTIYVLTEGQRIRLGTVTGLSKATFTIPSHLVVGAREMRFLADPIGGSRTPVSDRISVNPGDHVSLTIPPSASP